jgi:hypothetical protein
MATAKVDKYLITEHDAETGETTVRPMTAEEIAALPEPTEPFE